MLITTGNSLYIVIERLNIIENTFIIKKNYDIHHICSCEEI